MWLASYDANVSKFKRTFPRLQPAARAWPGPDSMAGSNLMLLLLPKEPLSRLHDSGYANKDYCAVHACMRATACPASALAWKIVREFSY